MLEPAGPGSSHPRTDLFQSLVSRLESLSENSAPLPLIFFARPHPRSGEVLYWSSDLDAWLPPLPPHSTPSRDTPLHVLVTRTGTEWVIHRRASDAGQDYVGDILWRLPAAVEKGAKSGSQDAPERANQSPDRTAPFFSARPSGNFLSVEVPGPLPDGLSGPFLPESCWLDIRWPVSPEIPGEEERPDEKSLRPPVLPVPFRLEVRFSGGRSIVLGGVYESSGRRMSLHARSSDAPILSRWEKMRPDVSRDLSEVLDIRLDERKGTQERGGE